MKAVFSSSIILALAGLISAQSSSSASGSEESTSTILVEASDEAYDWSAEWNPDIQIHTSCNRTQYNQISRAWEEAKILAGHARDHTSRFGNSSEFYQRYFGDAPTAEVIGWYDNVVNQDKTGALFRCDDIDGNCHQDGWAGHWRGENASDETVICDLSYTSRRYLSQMCSQGYTVSKGSTTIFWASDLLHRIWHTEVIGELTVDHYADTFDECLELAETNPEEAVRNSATLRYYALDVYAYDIASPGLGCSGYDPDELDSSSDSDSDSDSQSTAGSSATASDADTATQTTATGTECHTHSNGDVHCS